MQLKNMLQYENKKNIDIVLKHCFQIDIVCERLFLPVRKVYTLENDFCHAMILCCLYRNTFIKRHLSLGLE